MYIFLKKYHFFFGFCILNNVPMIFGRSNCDFWIPEQIWGWGSKKNWIEKSFFMTKKLLTKVPKNIFRKFSNFHSKKSIKKIDPKNIFGSKKKYLLFTMEISFFTKKYFLHFCHQFFCHEKNCWSIFFATPTPNLLRNPKVMVRIPKNHGKIVKNAKSPKK